MSKKSDIILSVTLDDQNVPKAINWKATDDPNGPTFRPAKAMLLSLFEENSRDILKIDLWTNELEVQEMDRLMYQTMRGLADTYFNATKNTELASDMQRFVQYFGEKTEVIPKSE